MIKNLQRPNVNPKANNRRLQPPKRINPGRKKKCKKVCDLRESNSGRPLGKRPLCHLTKVAIKILLPCKRLNFFIAQFMANIYNNPLSKIFFPALVKKT